MQWLLWRGRCTFSDASLSHCYLYWAAMKIYGKKNCKYPIYRNKRPGRLIFRINKKHSKTDRFCVLPPLKNHPSKPHRFCVLPPLKNHCFWWAFISGWALISANTVYSFHARFYFWTTLIAAIQGDPVPWAEFCATEDAYKPSCFNTQPIATTDPDEVPLLTFTNETVGAGIKPESAAQQYFDRAVLQKVLKF